MQEAQASCGVGGSDSPDALSTSSQLSFPPRPSVSLELYDRFVQNEIMDPANINPNEYSSPMDVDSCIDDIPSGIPPLTGDAICLPASRLSSRPGFVSSNNPDIPIPKKNPSKRVSTDIPPLASTSKKPSPLVEVQASSSNPPSETNRIEHSTTSTSSLSPSAASVTISASHRYNSRDLPPFIVQVQSTQESAHSHPLHISRTISTILPRGILEIRKSGRGKVLVQTSTYEVANRLVDNKSLPSLNLKAFIPSYRVLRCGIVRDVPQDVPIDILKESISSPIKILDLHRLNRRVKSDNEIQYVPSRTLCVKFSGQSLPRYIYLFNCRYPVAPFIPKTRICFSCFRVGHLSKACKSHPRCLFCGESAHDSSDSCPIRQAPPKCINCKGDHLATSHDCIKVIEHKMAHSLAATENISFIDALRTVTSSNSSSSPPSPFSSSTPSFSDPRLDYHNFPLFPKSRSSHSPLSSANRFAPLANLPSSLGDPDRHFSSILKHPAPSPSFSRPHPNPRNTRSSLAPPPASSPFLSPSNHQVPLTPASSYPKAHRDLLLEPHGRPLPPEGHHSYSPFSLPHPPIRESAHGRLEAPLEEVFQLLSHHAMMLQRLLVSLGGLNPTHNPNLHSDNFSPSYNLRPASSTYDANFPPLRVQDSHSPP